MEKEDKVIVEGSLQAFLVKETEQEGEGLA
jgi:hypothetical protein